MDSTVRFPEAAQNPRRIEDIARFIQVLQLANQFTLPVVSALPATGKPRQIVVLNDGAAQAVWWWDDIEGEWRELASGTGGELDINSIRGGPQQSIIAYELLEVGKFVNVFSDGGTVKARLAGKGALSTQAHAYVVTGAMPGGTAVIKYFMGVVGLPTGAATLGATQYLALTGNVSPTAPTSDGEIVQMVGVLHDATGLSMIANIGEPILLPVATGSGTGDDFFDY